ncbi:MAG TPA: hypothetical protein VM582_00435 [Candidatus Thermoplasmatota archaeon]|nr:hypothetical protein [Candidatus Thermoplasmatota archaeon]
MRPIHAPGPDRFEYGPAQAVAEESAEPTARVAVLVAHGMGEQIEYSTLDRVQRNLRLTSVEGWRALGAPRLEVVELEGERLRRAAITYARDGRTKEVHVYEAYWAPLTKGKVGVLDAATFLAQGAANGVRNGAGAFRRWVFGREAVYADAPDATPALMVGLATLASLVAMHFLAAAIVASRAWPGEALARELTFALLGVLGIAAALAGSLLAARHARRAAGQGRAPPAAAVGAPARAQVPLRSLLALQRAGMSVFGWTLGGCVGFLVAALVLVPLHAAGGAVPAAARVLAVALAIGLVAILYVAWSSGAIFRDVPKAVPRLARRGATTVAAALPFAAVALAAPRVGSPDMQFALAAAVIALAIAAIALATRARTRARRRAADAAPRPDPLSAAAPDARVKRTRPNDLLRRGRSELAVGVAAGLLGVALLAVLATPLLGKVPEEWAIVAAVALPGYFASASAMPRAGLRVAVRYALWSVACVALAAAAFAAVAWSAARPLDATLLAAWLLVAGASLLVRYFLVEFVGDVAAYVSPHKLDKFEDLRGEIKQRVRRVAAAIYGAGAARGAPTYERVVVLGHSLGSVVAYDVLNAMLLDDQLASASGRPRRDVARRTPLLLTFGSPLDRTAYVFASQDREPQSTRGALAMIGQPIISDVACRDRIEWVNVWSAADIVSSPLRFYDDPRGDAFPRVRNVEATDACTPLVAHDELWESPSVWGPVARAALG